MKLAEINTQTFLTKKAEDSTEEAKKKQESEQKKLAPTSAALTVPQLLNKLIESSKVLISLIQTSNEETVITHNEKLLKRVKAFFQKAMELNCTVKLLFFFDFCSFLFF